MYFVSVVVYYHEDIVIVLQMKGLKANDLGRCPGRHPVLLNGAGTGNRDPNT